MKDWQQNILKSAVIVSVMNAGSGWTMSPDEPGPDWNPILDLNEGFTRGASLRDSDLRSSFGWATYQEGRHGTSFYRLSPDGEARFGTDPSLREDYMDVRCAGEPVICNAWKHPLSLAFDGQKVTLSFHGHGAPRVQLELSDGEAIFDMPIAEFEMPGRFSINDLNRATAIILHDGRRRIESIDLQVLPSVLAYLRWVVLGESDHDTDFVPHEDIALDPRDRARRDRFGDMSTPLPPGFMPNDPMQAPHQPGVAMALPAETEPAPPDSGDATAEAIQRLADVVEQMGRVLTGAERGEEFAASDDRAPLAPEDQNRVALDRVINRVRMLTQRFADLPLSDTSALADPMDEAPSEPAERDPMRAIILANRRSEDRYQDPDQLIALSESDYRRLLSSNASDLPFSDTTAPTPDQVLGETDATGLSDRDYFRAILQAIRRVEAMHDGRGERMRDPSSKDPARLVHNPSGFDFSDTTPALPAQLIASTGMSGSPAPDVMADRRTGFDDADTTASWPWDLTAFVPKPEPDDGVELPMGGLSNFIVSDTTPPLPEQLVAMAGAPDATDPSIDEDTPSLERPSEFLLSDFEQLLAELRTVRTGTGDGQASRGSPVTVLAGRPAIDGPADDDWRSLPFMQPDRIEASDHPGDAWRELAGSVRQLPPTRHIARTSSRPVDLPSRSGPDIAEEVVILAGRDEPSPPPVDEPSSARKRFTPFGPMAIIQASRPRTSRGPSDDWRDLPFLQPDRSAKTTPSTASSDALPTPNPHPAGDWQAVAAFQPKTVRHAVVPKAILSGPQVPDTPADTAERPSGRALIRLIQTELTEAGHQPGPIDGIIGKKTKRAITAFFDDHGLAAERPQGYALYDLIRRTRSPADVDQPPPMATAEPVEPRPTGKALNRLIQAELAAAGQEPGPIDGIIGQKTTRAIQAFLDTYGLEPAEMPTGIELYDLIRRTRNPARTPAAIEPVENTPVQSGRMTIVDDNAITRASRPHANDQNTGDWRDLPFIRSEDDDWRNLPFIEADEDENWQGLPFLSSNQPVPGPSSPTTDDHPSRDWRTFTPRSRADDEATIIRTVQRELAELGYYYGPLDGEASLETNHAVATFLLQRGIGPDEVAFAPYLLDIIRNSRDDALGTQLAEAHADETAPDHLLPPIPAGRPTFRTEIDLADSTRFGTPFDNRLSIPDVPMTADATTSRRYGQPGPSEPSSGAAVPAIMPRPTKEPQEPTSPRLASSSQGTPTPMPHQPTPLPGPSNKRQSSDPAPILPQQRDRRKDTLADQIELVTAIQRELDRLGYDPGPIDGMLGPRTKAAIYAFQEQNALLPDGIPSAAVFDQLKKKSRSRNR